MKNLKVLMSTALVGVMGVAVLAACTPTTDPSESVTDPSTSTPSVTTPTVSPTEPSVSTTPTEPEPTVAPVTGITVLPIEDAVVNQVINLDDYVTVEGGAGPKVYEVLPSATSTDALTVDGHLITPTKEQEITLRISAGVQEAIVTFNVTTSGKLAFAAAQEALGSDYTTFEALIDENDMYTGEFGVATIRKQGAYLWQSFDNGGVIVHNDGTQYEFESKVDGTDFLVTPVIEATPLEYFFIMETISVNVADLVEEEVTNEDGSKTTTFTIERDVAPRAGWDQYFDNKTEEIFTILTGLGFNNPSLRFDAAEFTISDEGLLSVHISIYDIDAPEDVMSAGIYILQGGEDSVTIPAADAWIESGDKPAAIPATELSNALTDLKAATVYQIDTEYTGDPAVEGLTVETYVDEESLVLTTITDADGVSVSGYQLKDGVVYQIKGNVATVSTAPWAAVVAQMTYDSISDDLSQLVVLGVEESADKTTVDTSFSGKGMVDFIKNLISPFDIYDLVGQGVNLENITATARTTTATSEIYLHTMLNIYFTVGGSVETLTSIGEYGTAVAPDLSSVVYPTE